MRDLREDVPRLVLIGDGFTRPERREAVYRAVRGGVPWVHLRDHEADAAAFGEAVEDVVSELSSAGVRVSVNSRMDVAQRHGLGLHVGVRGPSVQEARRVLGEGAFVGASVHGDAEARAAVAQGADYLFFSPVYPTPSKPGHAGTGTAMLRSICTAVHPIPAYALGGITPGRVQACRSAGAHGIAVLSGILNARDPEAAARSYLLALRTSTDR